MNDIGVVHQLDHPSPFWVRVHNLLEHEYDWCIEYNVLHNPIAYDGIRWITSPYADFYDPNLYDMFLMESIGRRICFRGFTDTFIENKPVIEWRHTVSRYLKNNNIKHCNVYIGSQPILYTALLNDDVVVHLKLIFGDTICLKNTF